MQSYLAPFADILARDDVTDVYVNAPQEVWIETLGGENERHWVAGLDETALARLARQIAAYAHQGINREHPILSASLPSGERVQIIIPPATRGGVVVAIRKHVSSDLRLEDYFASGAFEATFLRGTRRETELDKQLRARLQDGDVAGLLREAVKGRRNILISGGTSTGKTTFLNALIQEIPQQERLIF
ncbi:P-type DNA transfer ATPase VirB11, partial [cyanobacterium TDX16]